GAHQPRGDTAASRRTRAGAARVQGEDRPPPRRARAPHAAGDSVSLPTSERDLFLRLVLAAEGLPYHWGGRTAAGLDCSGLVAWAALHATAGRLDLTRWWAQLMFDRWEPVSTEAAVAG